MDPILSSLERQFVVIDQGSRSLLELIDDELLYRRPREIDRQLTPFSCGEYLLRSGAMVEKTFGGITTRLWDDPFEWTLPEKLATKDSVIEYLAEVEKTRVAGFEHIRSDDQLQRAIPSPERIRPIIDIINECVYQAGHYQGRAFAIFQMLSGQKLPRL